jgi:hypothetical protein
MLASSRVFLAACASGLLVTLALGACGSSGGGGSGFGGAPEDGGSGQASSGGGGGGSSGSSGGASGTDGGTKLGVGSGAEAGATSTTDAGAVAVVYAHSDDILYELDPTSLAIKVVGPFIGCSEVIDIALDQSSNAYVTTESATGGTGGFYKLDVTTAICTHIADGSYPNSLSFVPKGTLDPNVEALVGYVGAQYVRIDTTSGAITNVGTLSGGYQSSGDIVSVIGGGTFLTVNGNGCGDCLLQVDPATGDLVQSYGSVSHADVYGLAFWGGTAYGFDNAGEVFSIDVAGGTLVTTSIPVPNPPLGLQFWGAGSTTAAPPTAADGGGIPIKQPQGLRP